MNTNLLFIFRPCDPSKDCHIAEFDDWSQVIAGCESVSKLKGINPKQALDILGIDQIAVDVIDFQSLSVSDAIKFLKGTTLKPGPRRGEAFELLRKICLLDFPFLDFTIEDGAQVVRVNTVTLIADNDSLHRWQIQAQYPDTEEIAHLPTIEVPAGKPFIKLLESLTWIDKHPGYFPNKDAFFNRVSKSIAPYYQGVAV